MLPDDQRGRARSSTRASRRAPVDIDVIWVNGYGWPVCRGGPMFWADSIGLKHVAERLALLRAGDRRPLAGARAAAEAARRRRQDLCVIGDREAKAA